MMTRVGRGSWSSLYFMQLRDTSYISVDIADYSCLTFYLPLVKIPFSKVVYIEQSDFRMKDSKDYYGLAPGKSVLLRCPYLL